MTQHYAAGAAAHSRMRLSAAFAIILSVMIATLLLASSAVTTGPGLVAGVAPSIMQLTFLVGAIEVAMTVLYIGIVNRLEMRAASEAASD